MLPVGILTRISMKMKSLCNGRVKYFLCYFNGIDHHHCDNCMLVVCVLQRLQRLILLISWLQKRLGYCMTNTIDVIR